MKILLGLAFIVIVAYWWRARKQKNLIEKSGFKKVRAKDAPAQSPQKKYRCVTIKLGHNPCEAAQVLEKKPILMNDAVALPLETCDAEKCDCKFLRYDDRRISERRNDLYVARQIMVDENNQREKKDRRSER